MGIMNDPWNLAEKLFKTKKQTILESLWSGDTLGKQSTSFHDASWILKSIYEYVVFVDVVVFSKPNISRLSLYIYIYTIYRPEQPSSLIHGSTKIHPPPARLLKIHPLEVWHLTRETPLIEKGGGLLLAFKLLCPGHVTLRRSQPAIWRFFGNPFDWDETTSRGDPVWREFSLLVKTEACFHSWRNGSVMCWEMTGAKCLNTWWIWLVNMAHNTSQQSNLQL